MATYDFHQIHHVANVLEEAFGDDEAPRQGLLCLLLDHARQYVLEIPHVIVFVPSNRAAGDLHALPDGEVNSFVGDDDVASFGECWNDAGYR